MNFYTVNIDLGKRKRFACGCFSELFCEPILTLCSKCGEEYSNTDYDKMFADKAWHVGMYMDRDYYADFASSQFRPIVSAKAKRILAENCSNATDFGDIKMVSFRDLTREKLKQIRDWAGYADTKKIPNDPPQYYRLLLKQGAELDFQKSNIKLTIDCTTCGRKNYDIPYSHYGPNGSEQIYIIESTWVGYDIFYAEGKGNTLFCTERFIEIYEKNKLSGLRFEKIQTV